MDDGPHPLTLATARRFVLRPSLQGAVAVVLLAHALLLASLHRLNTAAWPHAPTAVFAMQTRALARPAPMPSRPEPAPTPARPASPPPPKPAAPQSARQAALPPSPPPLPQPAATAPADSPPRHPSAGPPPAAADGPLPEWMATWPLSTRLQYRLTAVADGAPLGTATLDWETQGTRYVMTLQTSPQRPSDTPALQIESQGDITADGLAPTQYTEQTPDGRIQMQMDAQSLVLADGRRVQQPPGARTLDMLTQLVVLSHTLITQESPPEPEQNMWLWVLRPDGAEPWAYTIAEQLLQWPLSGNQPALHLARDPATPAAAGASAATAWTDIWLAPGADYAPLQLRMQSAGQSIDLMLESASRLDTAP